MNRRVVRAPLANARRRALLMTVMAVAVAGGTYWGLVARGAAWSLFVLLVASAPVILLAVVVCVERALRFAARSLPSSETVSDKRQD